jgi:hypothetical protein
VEKWAIGGGYYVRATLPDATVDRIDGFTTECEAGRWIKTSRRFGCTRETNKLPPTEASLFDFPSQFLGALCIAGASCQQPRFRRSLSMAIAKRNAGKLEPRLGKH